MVRPVHFVLLVLEVLKDLENLDLLQVQQDPQDLYPQVFQTDLSAPQDLVVLCLQWGLLVLTVQEVLVDQPDQEILTTRSDLLVQLDLEVHWVLAGPTDLETLKFQQVHWIR